MSSAPPPRAASPAQRNVKPTAAARQQPGGTPASTTPVRSASKDSINGGDPERERLQLLQIHLLACCRGVFQMARICMGPLAVNMSAEYGWTPDQKGRILSAFAAGYALTQISGGLAADKFGGQPLLLLGLVTSGAALIAMPFAADGGVDQLWWLLWIMGLLQGPTYPAQLVTTAKWASAGLRSYASALGGTGSTAGSLLALGLTPVMAGRIGWRGTSLFFGVLTMFFGVLEFFLGQSAPSWKASDKSASSKVSEDWSGKFRTWCRVLLAIPVLVIFVAHATHNFVRYFLMAWMPTYYSEVLLVSSDAAALHLMIPEICGLIASMVGASIGRKSQQGGWLSPLSSRRLFASMAFGGSFIGLILISQVTKPVFVTLFLCIVQGLATLQGLGWGANYLDVSKHNGGLVTGVGNTVATGASFCAPVFASSLLPTDGKTGPETWQRLFLAFAASNLVGLGLFVPFCSTTAVDIDDKEGKKK